MYLSVFIPISHPSQPCSAPGRARLGPSCPAALSCPQALWGCAGPGLVEVPWAFPAQSICPSRHCGSILA